MNARQIADHYIGAAKKFPDDRHEIFRKAAYTFMGLAQDRRNVHATRDLAQIGLAFAQAAGRERPATMTDFADLLRETQVAYDQTDDPMDLVARRREIHDERTVKTPGRVSIAPESFNKDATLGRSAVVQSFVGMTPEEKAAAIKNGISDTQTVAFWQGTKNEAQAITVDCALVLLPALLAQTGEVFNQTNNRPYGLVEFGSDGNRTTVKFDIGNGKRFTVVGNYVSVSIGMDSPRPGDTSTPLTIGASIGCFAAPSEAPIILTGYIDELSNLGTPRPPPSTLNNNQVIVPIPLKAVALMSVLTDLSVGEQVLLEFLDVGGDVMFKIFYKQSDTFILPTIQLIGDVSFIKVTNATTNAGAANIRLPFQLSM